jgi:hypothetical protein
MQMMDAPIVQKSVAAADVAPRLAEIGREIFARRRRGCDAIESEAVMSGNRFRFQRQRPPHGTWCRRNLFPLDSKPLHAEPVRAVEGDVLRSSKRLDARGLVVERNPLSSELLGKVARDIVRERVVDRDRHVTG